MSVTTRRDAASIREEWLRVALSTEPADRPEAESAIAGLYRLNGLPPPRFHWVSSPAAAADLLRAHRHESLTRLFEARRQTMTRALDSGMAARPGRRRQVFWQVVDPLARSGLPNRLVVYDHDRAWPEVHDVSWLAGYDCLPWVPGVEGIDLWDRAARAGGWWVPFRQVCVVVDRPCVVHTQPGPEPGVVLVHGDDGPAVVYRDGRSAYAWRGLSVPPWVVEEPTAARIRDESDPDIRLAAIQRMGWPEFVDQTAGRLIATAPDPGNDAELLLYDVMEHTVLIVVNGTVERDGTRRRYGLIVPEDVADPVEAAAWTYGITAPLYRQLVRRT
ncbi:hypothetical protein FDA94_05965 [Herbidospora galbida]|uniref:DUF6745 domain-containing protein n=1 Tax=Herbidospora galbida TaxID=2575442 RepID=A0A4U3MQZ4_9ACTN|nr:hypothetical protein [Herbidospora galbida]TKK90536.1 hypothetical protein FDA94_05965 [Herbidospora galbida]